MDSPATAVSRFTYVSGQLAPANPKGVTRLLLPRNTVFEYYVHPRHAGAWGTEMAPCPFPSIAQNGKE